jgi:hypothetical protein
MKHLQKPYHPIRLTEWFKMQNLNFGSHTTGLFLDYVRLAAFATRVITQLFKLG